jgi:anaphase-promoting complex subunit 8
MRALNRPFSSANSRVVAPQMSQKSMFLSLYEMLIAGEKKKNEESGITLSQQDVGTLQNERLSEIAFELGTWFKEMDKTSLKASSQGWLEYLLVSWTGRPRPKADSW